MLTGAQSAIDGNGKITADANVDFVSLPSPALPPNGFNSLDTEVEIRGRGQSFGHREIGQHQMVWAGHGHILGTRELGCTSTPFASRRPLAQPYLQHLRLVYSLD